MGMFGRDPFYMKIKPSLDPVSSKTRVNLVFRHGRLLEDLLIDYVMRTVSLSCILPVTRSFFGFEFIYITATITVTLPVSLFYLSILETPFLSNEKALILVSLIGQGTKNVVSKAGCKSCFLNYKL